VRTLAHAAVRPLAGDGLEAFAKIDAASFDAVVLDLLMPGLDGMTVSAAPCGAAATGSRS
jgi:CheY-like chemotaxis protein